MRVIWIAFCLSLTSWSVAADPIPVRTGEHSSFTRVVLEIAPDAAWALGRSEEGYVLRLDTDAGFDLNGFFDIIPRTRIQSATQDVPAGELTMEVTCECNASAFVLRDSLLVIDIADGLPSRSARFELPLPDLASEFVEVQQPVGTPFVISRAPLLPIVINDTEQPPTDDTATASIDAREPEVTTQAETISEITNELEIEVASILGNALSQGLVSPSAHEGRGEVDDALAGIRLRADEIPGVETRTSIDPLSGQTAERVTETQTGVACLPAQFLDVPSWGGDGDFSDQLSRKRPLLFGEFDRPDEDAIAAMARIYIYFGFGQEAQQTLALDQKNSQERLHLMALSRIIDNQPVNPQIFGGQESCASNVALWALLAAADQPLVGRVDRDAVLQNFKALPAHLQDNLGPRLSRVFTRIGDLDAAEQVGKRFDTNATNASEAAIAQSVLAEDEVNTAAVMTPLEDVVTQSPRATPALMTRYFEEGVANGKAFDSEDFVLSDALRFENADSDDVLQLTAAQFRAHLSVGDFAAGRELLERDFSNLTPEILLARVAEYSKAAVQTMSDAEFGRFVWSGTHVTNDPKIRNEIAERVGEIGFAEMAENLRVASSAPVAVQQAPLIASIADNQNAGEEVTLEQPTPPAGSLARARALLADSQEFRAALETQLNARATEEITRN